MAGRTSRPAMIASTDTRSETPANVADVLDDDTVRETSTGTDRPTKQTVRQTVKTKDYTLNPKKAIKKKRDACDRVTEIEDKAGNLILTPRAGEFETVRTIILERLIRPQRDGGDQEDLSVTTKKLTVGEILTTTSSNSKTGIL